MQIRLNSYLSNLIYLSLSQSTDNSQSTYNPQYWFPSRKEIQRSWPFNPVYDDVPTERRKWKAAHGGSDLEMIVPPFAQSKEALRM